MKESVGVATTYGVVLPHLKRLLALNDLSKEARVRLKWIDAYLRWKNARKVCRRFGITPNTFYLWYNRFKKLDIRGLESRSKRPRRFRASQIPLETSLLVDKLRRSNPAWSKYKISEILRRDHDLDLSPSTVNRIFHQRSLFFSSPLTNKRKAMRKWQIERHRVPKELKGAFPGSLVEVDVKYLSSFGQTFYQFTAVDTCTRIKFIRVYSNKSALRGEAFIKELIVFMPFAIKHIQSDNGGEFLSSCHKLLEEQGISHFFSYPQCPKQQGHVERTIQSDEYEYWLWGNMANTVEELNQKAEIWTKKWNTYRPHQALNMSTPMAYYQNNFQTANVSTM